MKRLTSLYNLMIFVGFFLICEFILHLVLNKFEFNRATVTGVEVIQTISVVGAIIESAEIVFGIKIKSKIKQTIEYIWVVVKRKFK